MLIIELINRVEQLYSKGAPSDDARLSKRLIYNKLKSSRSLLLQRKLSKKQRLSIFSYQTIGCLEMVKSTPYECGCVPPIGCKVFKSVEPLPDIITSSNGALISSITSLDGYTRYSYVPFQQIKYLDGNKYTGSNAYYFIRNNHLFTIQTVQDHVSVEAVFEDPLEVEVLNKRCLEGDCVDIDEVEFNIDLDLIDPLIDLAVQELVNLFLTVPEDKVNDTEERDMQHKR